jgi:FkbM family methyltransferase
MAGLGVGHALSRLVPETRLKGTLRLWYYALTGKINRQPVTGERLPFTVRYQFLLRRFRLRFDQGPLRGQELLFPLYYDALLHPTQVTAPWAFVWGVGSEVASYFGGPALTAGDLVVDAGGCPGDYCLLADRVVGPTGKVVALEADAYSARYLEQVVELNGAMNCCVRHVALAGQSGHVTLTNDELGAQMTPSEGDGTQAVTFDDLVAEHDPERTRRRVLKMDIEGGEMDVVPAVLAGTDPPDIWIIAAYHPDRQTGEPTHLKLAPMLAAAGYECKLGEHDHKVLFAWRRTA